MPEESVSQFADWLQNLRGTSSKAAVAKGAQVPRTSISKAERGKRLLKYATLERLCRYYNVPVKQGLALMDAASEERYLTRKGNGNE